jgi:hypothetical protein
VIHWAWLLPAIGVGFIFGLAALAVLVAGRDDYYYRKGFVEGQRDAYKGILEENVRAQDWRVED